VRVRLILPWFCEWPEKSLAAQARARVIAVYGTRSNCQTYLWEHMREDTAARREPLVGSWLMFGSFRGGRGVSRL